MNDIRKGIDGYVIYCEIERYTNVTKYFVENFTLTRVLQISFISDPSSDNRNPSIPLKKSI